MGFAGVVHALALWPDIWEEGWVVQDWPRPAHPQNPGSQPGLHL